jgi:hypothetical protein
MPNDEMAEEPEDDVDADAASWMTLPAEPPAPPPGMLGYEPVHSKHRLREIRGRQLALASLILGLLVPVMIGVILLLARQDVDSMFIGLLMLVLASTMLAALICARMADRRRGNARQTWYGRIAAVGWLVPAVLLYIASADRVLIAIRNAVIFAMIVLTVGLALLMFLDTVFDGD